jgi:uncharacterized membrane protein
LTKAEIYVILLPSYRSAATGAEAFDFFRFAIFLIDAMRVSYISVEVDTLFVFSEVLMNRKSIQKMVIAALFLALAYVLPFLTGQIPEIGAMLCPMHIPVLLSGFVCGWQWGLAVGLIAPLFRSLTLGMPPIFPTAVCMALELAAYGAVAGLMHRILPRKRGYVYPSLLSAMLAGRIVWGAAMFICLGATGGGFTFAAFIAGAITNAIPGIILQLVLIPIAVMLIEGHGLVRLDKNDRKTD